jgi:hypothetical protein
MSTESHHEPEGGAAAVASVRSASGSRHGSSKMLESYLVDIEYLVHERLWAEAVPLALALPHICAALGERALRSSRESFLHWCECWVRPEQDDTSLTVPSPQTLYRLSQERAAGAEPDPDDTARVPIHALRQLRLRRLARAAPAPPRNVSPAILREAAEEPAYEACVALLAAVRRWYSDWAAREPMVQTNLARLAVLR